MERSIRARKIKKPSQSLAFCDVFKKLPLNQRFSTAKKLKACLRCLQPSHLVKDCKMTQLKCRTCSSETHSTLLCRSADDAVPKAKGKEPVSGGAFTTETEVKGVDPAGAVEPAAVAPPETMSNMASTYDHLDTEAYLLSRDGSGSNLTHTCVGQACVIDRNNREVHCGTLFDHCSSDAWITASFARQIGAKRLPGR